MTKQGEMHDRGGKAQREDIQNDEEEIFASFESQMGGLPGQARAQARRSERLTRVV